MVMGAHEYKGNGLPLYTACEDFRTWTDSNSLVHLLTRGAKYSWSNGRRGLALTEKRLDRVVCNDAWLNYWTNVSVCTLIRSRSDHHPIMLEMKMENRTFASSFKFMRMWSSDINCENLIEEV